jgi:Ser/Thr protein kinase RdoA (MazF antagonist)
VLRVHRPWADPDRLALVHRIRMALADDGLPALAPLPAEDGAFTVSWHGRLVEAAQLVDHEGPAATRQAAPAVFGGLARLHDALAGWRLELTITPPQPRTCNHMSLLEASDWLTALQHRLTSTGEGTGDSLATVRVAVDLLDRLGDLPVPDCRQPTYVDVSPYNFLVNDGVVAAIVDFDMLTIAERAYDVAYALAVFGWAGADASATGRWQDAAVLLSAYNHAASLPLSPEEVASIPALMARLPVVQAALAASISDPASDLAKLAPHLAWGRHIIERHSDVSRQLTGAAG